MEYIRLRTVAKELTGWSKFCRTPPLPTSLLRSRKGADRCKLDAGMEMVETLSCFLCFLLWSFTTFFIRIIAHIVRNNGTTTQLSHIIPVCTEKEYLSRKKTFFHTFFSEIITNSQNANFQIKIKSNLGTKPIKSVIIRCVSTISHNATENNNFQFLRF